MIQLSKQRLAAFILIAAAVGGAAGYHLAPPARERPLLKLLQKALKLGGFIWFFSEDEPMPRPHITHAAPASADHIDHRRAL